MRVRCRMFALGIFCGALGMDTLAFRVVFLVADYDVQYGIIGRKAPPYPVVQMLY